MGERGARPYARAVDPSLVARVLCKDLAVVPAPVHASSQASGGGCTVRVPGSKSISNRALLLAPLAQGTCRITGLLQSDDTQARRPY